MNTPSSSALGVTERANKYRTGEREIPAAVRLISSQARIAMPKAIDRNNVLGDVCPTITRSYHYDSDQPLDDSILQSKEFVALESTLKDITFEQETSIEWKFIVGKDGKPAVRFLVCEITEDQKFGDRCFFEVPAASISSVKDFTVAYGLAQMKDRVTQSSGTTGSH